MNPRNLNPHSPNLPPIRNPHSPIRNRFCLLTSVFCLLPLTGCWDNTPPPPRVPVPGPTSYQRQPDPVRPLATGSTVQEAAAATEAPMPFYDEPLVSQRPPEQQRFVQTYNAVGRPRLVLFVNRTLEGHIIPATASAFAPPPETYLQPGQYDEASVRSLDYYALENIMTDWLAANGQVVVTSPTLARQRLSDETVKEMQAGRPHALSEIAQNLNADILIQVAARPTRQTAQGLEIRLVAEAMNIKGGQSIGRAVVDVPPPLEKAQLNKYTRYLARKLMDDMTQTWSAPPPPDNRRPTDPPTTTTPSSTPAAPTPPAPTQGESDRPRSVPSAQPTPPAAPTPPAPPAPPAAPQPPAVQVTPPPAPNP